MTMATAGTILPYYQQRFSRKQSYQTHQDQPHHPHAFCQLAIGGNDAIVLKNRWKPPNIEWKSVLRSVPSRCFFFYWEQEQSYNSWCIGCLSEKTYTADSTTIYILPRKLTCPVKNSGWKTTSFWNGPFLGDLLSFRGCTLFETEWLGEKTEKLANKKTATLPRAAILIWYVTKSRASLVEGSPYSTSKPISFHNISHMLIS